MKRMSTSNVLIVGLDGLGVEIGERRSRTFLDWQIDSVAAKNVALAGVKSLTIFDPEPVKIQDLGTQVRRYPSIKCAALTDFQFFLRESDIGKQRAEATLPRLAELNAYVPVQLLSDPGQELSPDMIKGFQARFSLGRWITRD